MIEIEGRQVIITTVADLIHKDEPISDTNISGHGEYNLIPIIEKCQVWIHIGKDGKGTIMKNRSDTQAYTATCHRIISCKDKIIENSYKHWLAHKKINHEGDNNVS